MFRSGEFVKSCLSKLDGTEIEDERVGPAGVDLGIDEVKKVTGVVCLEDGEYQLPERATLDAYEGVVMIRSDPHIIVYDVKVEVPDDHIGFVLPRSRLMRSGWHLTTAVWEPGYAGNGEGLLMPMVEGLLDVTMSVAQMVMVPVEDSGIVYDGVHQGERIDE